MRQWTVKLLNVQVVRSGNPGSVEEVQVDSSNLAWEADRRVLFGDIDPANHNTEPHLRGGRGLEMKLNQDEFFMTWMRISAHPSVSCPSSNPVVSPVLERQGKHIMPHPGLV